MLDQLVALDVQERQLGRAAVGIQDAKRRLFVPHRGGAILPALDAHSGPGGQLVGDVVHDGVGMRHPLIVPPVRE